LGGITGLAGILVTIWCGLRGWPKDVQRAVFQPVAVATFLVSALWIGAKGALSADTIKLFLIGLPALFAGTWLGLKLFGRLDEAAFRKIVLVLLLASGAVLMLSSVPTDSARYGGAPCPTGHMTNTQSSTNEIRSSFPCLSPQLASAASLSSGGAMKKRAAMPRQRPAGSRTCSPR
jgi:uncharacterized membrane protein YfcA